MTIIREMHDSDAEAVFALWDAAGQEATEGGQFTELEAQRVLAVIKRYIQHPALLSFVAEQGGEVVGYVLAYVTEPHPAYEDSVGLGKIDEYYIESELRKTDIGGRLLDRVVATMSELGVAVISARVDEEIPSWSEFWQGSGWSRDSVRYSWYAYLHKAEQRQAA